MSDDTGTPAADAGTGSEPGAAPPAPSGATTFTQKEVNALIAKEKGRIQARYEGFDDIKSKAAEYDKLAEASKTETQRLSETAASAASRADSAELKALKYEVAAAAGMDLKHAHRLVGKTQKELEEDAKSLAEDFPAVAAVIPPGAARTPAGGNDMNSIIRRAAGRSG